jgi:Glutathione S-transferase, N-terminal domain
VILYTCPREDRGRVVFAHPCARAARALRAAGYEFEIKAVKGYRLLSRRWTSRDEDRAEVRKLSGWNDVPIVLLDDGEVISGSRVIVRWARENPAPKAEQG